MAGALEVMEQFGWRLLTAVTLLHAPAPMAGEIPPLRIVAIGASNTSGWGVGEAAAYPARLEALLRACGYDVRVINAGVPFETTNGMLRRIDDDVPDGTHAVVIQPGGNDLRFFGTRERRRTNILAMRDRLTERGIVSILYDPIFPPEIYQWDRIHITAEGHDWIARDVLPEIVTTLPPPRARRSGDADCGPARPRASVRETGRR